MRSKGFAVVAAVLLTSFGCVPKVSDDLPRITSPRILALKVSLSDAKGQPGPAAEMAPNSPGALRALVAVPPDRKAPDVAWQLCLERKPLTDLGAVNTGCLEPSIDGSVVPVLARGLETTFRVPATACSLFGPLPEKGRAVDPDPTGGYYLPLVAFLGPAPTAGAVRLDCPEPWPVSVKADYAARHIPNTNPEIASLHVASGSRSTDIPGAPDATQVIATAPGERVTLTVAWEPCARPKPCGADTCGTDADASACAAQCAALEQPASCTGAESYPFYDAAAGQLVSRREGITVSFYATDGSFDNEATGVAENDADVANTSNAWTAPAAASEGTLWAVIRDDRGGVSWQTYGFTTR